MLVSNINQVGVATQNDPLSRNYAQSFTTGGHQPGYTLSSVDLVFFGTFHNDLFRTSNPRFTLKIQNESGGKPGTTVLGTLKFPSSSPSRFGGTPKTFTFAAQGKGIRLEPSTTYFVVIGVNVSDDATDIRTINSNAENAGGAAGFSIGDSSYSRVISSHVWNPWDYEFEMGINGELNPITDLIQMKNATRSIAEFGAPRDPKTEDSLRVVVDIGDGLSPQGRSRTVEYTVGGTAILGTDYKIDGCTSSSCEMVFAANRHSLIIPIDVINDYLDEDGETIIITLQPGSGYTVNDAKKTTTVTIGDDDTRGLMFNRGWVFVDEGGGSRDYKLKLSSQPTAAVTVNIASDNPDVTVSPASLTFNPSGSSNRWNAEQKVKVSAAQDSDAVNDEAILTFTTSGGDYGGANALSYERSISVKDDDTADPITSNLPRISLEGGADVTEGAAATFTVNADPAPTSSLTVSVEVFEPPGQDFLAASQERVRTVTLNAGATSTTFTVPTVDDGVDEDDSYVQAFVNDGTGYNAGQGSAVRVLDNDDLIPGAYFRSASSDTDESGGTHEVRVELNYPAPSGGLTLRYSLSGTATAGSGNDFTIQNSGTVSIPERSPNATIPVAINDDSSKENAETVILELIGGTGYTVDSPSVHTLTIEDNDSTSASFSTGASSADEDAGTHNVTVQLSQAAPAGGLTINYSVAGTATAGSGNDFTIASSGSLSIAQGSSSAEIAVAINDESAEEAAETVILTLTSGAGYTLGSTTTHTLTIAENDLPAISARVTLFESSSPMPEGARGKTNMVLNRPLRNDEMATLPLTIGGTATLGTDYRLTCVSQEPVVFWTCSDLTGNNPSITLDGALLEGRHRFGGPLYIEALEDNTAESDETVILSLGGKVFTLTIKDAPSSAALTFTKNAYRGNEQYNVVEPIMRLTPALGKDVTIPLIFTDISATGGVDYTVLTQVVLKATGDDTHTVIIPILPDTVYEGDETFTVAIDTANLPTGVTAGATTSATVTIEDDDPAPNSQLVLSRSSLTVAEGSTGSYTLKLATQPTGTVTVNIASSNNDVTVSPNPVTFQSSGSSKLWSAAQTITVTAAQDVDATDDSGTLTHTASGGGYGSVTGSVSVTVNDDDGPTNHRPVLEDGMAKQTATEGSAFSYTFSANAFIDRDGDSLTYTAKLLTNNVEGPLPVWLTLNSSTRTFSGTPGSGDAGTLLIRVWADDSNGGTASGTFILTVSAATNNVPTASFGSASSSAAENAGTRSVNVNLSSAAPSGGLTLNYSVSGTATAGSGNDFTIQNSGSLTVAAEATSVSIPVAINDDSVTESDETVILTLIGGTGYTLGGTTVHTLTITDNDSTSASFALSASSADEDAGTHNVTVNLSSAAPSGGLTLGYSVSGTATPGSGNDFTIENSGTLSVAPGATTATIPVVISDDNAPENAETVILTLTGGAGYTLGTATVHTLTITNDDGHEVSFTAAEDRIPEGREHTVAVRIFPVSDDSTNVISYTISGTATAEEDYEDLPVMVEVPAGESQAVIRIETIADKEDDSGETVILTLQSDMSQELSLGSRSVHTLTIVDSKEAIVEAGRSWLVRFGRSVAEQVVDSISQRLRATRSEGTQINVAGAQVPIGQSRAFGTFEPPTNNRPIDDFDTHSQTAAQGSTQTLSEREVIQSSSFMSVSESDAQGGSFAVWGRAAHSSFEGHEDKLSLDGDSTSVMLGADYAQQFWQAGATLIQSEGKGEYRDEVISGDAEASITSIVPWAAVQATERVQLWGALGTGDGDLELTEEDSDTLKTNIDWSMAAAGLRSVLVPASGQNGLQLSLVGDALWVETKADPIEGLSITDTDASRLRLGLEGEYASELSSGAEMISRLEFGIREDSGDAETGGGIEIGGGVAWRDASSGLKIELAGRKLLTYDADELEDEGFSLSFDYDPAPGSAEGLSLSLNQEIGVRATGGLEALFDSEPLATRTDGEKENRMRLEAAYGVPVLSGRFIAGPQAAMSRSATTRDYSLGWNVVSARRYEDISLQITAVRSESHDRNPEHGISLGINARW